MLWCLLNDLYKQGAENSMDKKLLLLGYMIFGCDQLHPYKITNSTNFPTKVELTTIYQTIDNKYHQSTISLNFKPGESKNVPVGWMKSMRAMINEHGTYKATPVMNGRVSEGNSSAPAPSWIISPAQQDQFGQEAYMIQMAI